MCFCSQIDLINIKKSVNSRVMSRECDKLYYGRRKREMFSMYITESDNWEVCENTLQHYKLYIYINCNILYLYKLYNSFIGTVFKQQNEV